MSRENARDKASRYLLEGRVIIATIRRDYCHARIRGDGHVYTAEYRDRSWRCNCPARSIACAHVLAVQRVVAVDIEDRR